MALIDGACVPAQLPDRFAQWLAPQRGDDRVAEIRVTDTLIEHHRTGVGEAKPGPVDHGTTSPHAAVSVEA